MTRVCRLSPRRASSASAGWRSWVVCSWNREDADGNEASQASTRGARRRSRSAPGRRRRRRAALGSTRLAPVPEAIWGWWPALRRARPVATSRRCPANRTTAMRTGGAVPPRRGATSRTLGRALAALGRVARFRASRARTRPPRGSRRAPAARASLLPALLRRHIARPVQTAAGPRRRELPMVQDLLSVHEHVRKPYRRLVRLLERRLVGHRRRIEPRDVGRQACLEQ